MKKEKKQHKIVEIERNVEHKWASEDEIDEKESAKCRLDFDYFYSLRFVSIYYRNFFVFFFNYYFCASIFRFVSTFLVKLFHWNWFSSEEFYHKKIVENTRKIDEKEIQLIVFTQKKRTHSANNRNGMKTIRISCFLHTELCVALRLWKNHCIDSFSRRPCFCMLVMFGAVAVTVKKVSKSFVKRVNENKTSVHTELWCVRIARQKQSRTIVEYKQVQTISIRTRTNRATETTRFEAEWVKGRTGEVSEWNTVSSWNHIKCMRSRYLWSHSVERLSSAVDSSAWIIRLSATTAATATVN